MRPQSLHIVSHESNLMQPAPYTADSIAQAKAFQEQERLRAAREIGIPSDLIALYDVHGFEQMRKWTYAITALRQA